MDKNKGKNISFNLDVILGKGGKPPEKDDEDMLPDMAEVLSFIKETVDDSNDGEITPDDAITAIDGLLSEVLSGGPDSEDDSPEDMPEDDMDKEDKKQNPFESADKDKEKNNPFNDAMKDKDKGKDKDDNTEEKEEEDESDDSRGISS